MTYYFVTKEDALKRVSIYKKLYFVSVSLLLLLPIIYFLYSLVYEVDAYDVLIDQRGSVYINEDLSQMTTSEGDVLQLAFDSVALVFTYNYLSFVKPDDYESMLSGAASTEIPDHRDRLRFIFSEEARLSTIQNLENAVWMNRFYDDKREIRALPSNPPMSMGFSLEDGRLVSSYNGFFHVFTSGLNRRTLRYRVDYVVEMERRPATARSSNIPDYFFKPLVPDNITEWRVRSLNWEVRAL